MTGEQATGVHTQWLNRSMLATSDKSLWRDDSDLLQVPDTTPFTCRVLNLFQFDSGKTEEWFRWRTKRYFARVAIVSMAFSASALHRLIAGKLRRRRTKNKQRWENAKRWSLLWKVSEMWSIRFPFFTFLFLSFFIAVSSHLLLFPVFFLFFSCSYGR